MGITATLVGEALSKGKAERPRRRDRIYHGSGSAGVVARGTVIAGGGSVHGYPHIKRIFTLEKG